MASANPARGTRDFLPADVRKREYVIGIIKEVYESYGFEPLETPAVENLETLMGKYGEEGNQLIYKILKRGEKLAEELQSYRVPEYQSAGSEKPGTLALWHSGNSLCDLALRYDLTVPLARVVGNNRERLPKFFKRYQIQPVWRADRPARGRYREFYQCDADAIGSSSMTVEAELILAVDQILTRLGFSDFVIRVNHRQVLTDILDTAGMPVDLHSDALVAIDKLDKMGIDGVGEELRSRGVSDAAAEMLTDIFSSTAEMLMQEGDVNRMIVGNLLNIVRPETLADLGRIVKLAGKSCVRLDPSLARGLSYYTGAIIEVNVPDLAGSLAGGGRYDGLIGMFGKEQIPACGISLGLERILVVMDERGMFPPEIADSTAADVMITILSDETATESLSLAAELRSKTLRVLVYPEPDKFARQMKYAHAVGVPWVCILGEKEIGDGSVTLKNMKTGEQTSHSRSALATAIAVHPKQLRDDN